MSPRHGCSQIRSLYYLATLRPQYAAECRASARRLLSEVGGVGVYLEWMAALPPVAPWVTGTLADRGRA
jgi:hypothetical protein